jgi:hypothetical protein
MQVAVWSMHHLFKRKDKESYKIAPKWVKKGKIYIPWSSWDPNTRTFRGKKSHAPQTQNTAKKRKVVDLL